VGNYFRLSFLSVATDNYKYRPIYIHVHFEIRAAIELIPLHPIQCSTLRCQAADASSNDVKSPTGHPLLILRKAREMIAIISRLLERTIKLYTYHRFARQICADSRQPTNAGVRTPDSRRSIFGVHWRTTWACTPTSSCPCRVGNEREDLFSLFIFSLNL